MSTQYNANRELEGETRDPDFVGAEAAIQRAARVARRKAMDTLGSVVVFKDGRVVWQKEDGTLLDEPEHYERGFTHGDD